VDKSNFNNLLIMACATNFITPHVRGTWFYGVEMIFSNINEDLTKTPINLTGYGVLITLKLSENSPVTYEFKTEDSTITITDAVNGKIMLEPRGDLNVIGNYLYSIYLIDTSDRLVPFFSDYWQIVENPAPPTSYTIINE